MAHVKGLTALQRDLPEGDGRRRIEKHYYHLPPAVRPTGDVPCVLCARHLQDTVHSFPTALAQLS